MSGVADDRNSDRRLDLRAYIERTREYPGLSLLRSVDKALRIEGWMRGGRVTEEQAAHLFDPGDPAAFGHVREEMADAKRALRVAGHPIEALTVAWWLHRDGEAQRSRTRDPRVPAGGPALDRHGPHEVLHGRVRVRLFPPLGSIPFAEFELSEVDLASRIHPADTRTRRGTIAHQAVRTAWSLSQFAADGVPVDAGAFPPEYGPQIEAYRATGQPGLDIGERVEVTRSNGARSMWRCEPVGWVLVDRRSAALVAVTLRRRAERARQVHNCPASAPAPAVDGGAGRQLGRQP